MNNGSINNLILELLLKIENRCKLSKEELTILKELPDTRKLLALLENSVKPEHFDEETQKLLETAEDVWQNPKFQVEDDLAPLPDNLIYSSCKNLQYLQNNEQTVYVKTTSYDDLGKIADRLVKRLPIVVNFGDLDKEIAQRMVDFLSGVVFTCNGEVKKIDGNTILFDPRQQRGE